jgi:hypothetical protein
MPPFDAWALLSALSACLALHERRLPGATVLARADLPALPAAWRVGMAQALVAQPGGCVRFARHACAIRGAGLLVRMRGDTARQTPFVAKQPHVAELCLTQPRLLAQATGALSLAGSAAGVEGRRSVASCRFWTMRAWRLNSQALGNRLRRLAREGLLPADWLCRFPRLGPLP